MWISKQKYNEMVKKIEEYEDDSGEALIERLMRLAKKAKLDTNSKEYQDLMHRVFMDVGGRQSAILRGYSQTSFLKDAPALPLPVP